MKDGEKLANPPMGCKIACYREEPGAGKLHAGICEGGVGQPAFLPRLSKNKSMFRHYSFVARIEAAYRSVNRVHLLTLIVGGLFISLTATAQNIVINEAMARNKTTIADPRGEFDDWIELYNGGDQPVDIGGHFITDDDGDLSKHAFPTSAPSATTIPAGGYLLLWADGDVDGGPLHLPFRLSSLGEAISLVAADETTVLDRLSMPRQYPDISFGRLSSEDRTATFLIRPTPGEANDSFGVDVLGGIQFSRNAGVFTEPFDLTLATETTGAQIRYTIDGRPPSPGSPVYQGPVLIEKAGVVRAALFVGEEPLSIVESRVYLGVDEELSRFTSNLPLVLIDSNGVDLTINPRSALEPRMTAVSATILDVSESGRAMVANPVDFAGRAGMYIRGASSKDWPKKQYKLELWGERNEDQAAALLGMPADADWVLAAPYFDKTLMRNVLIFRWWERLGHYSPRTRFVEAFINMDGDNLISMDDYVGVYVLTEKIKRAPHRVNVAALEPTDTEEPEITGGYVLGTTNLDADFTSRRGIFFEYVSPKRGDRGFEIQKGWIRDYVNALEGVLFRPTFGDPERGFRKFLDVPSSVDYDIMRELSRNIDGASTFMSLDRGGKMRMGPLWDYNQSLGMTSLWNGFHTEGWNDAYQNAGHWLSWWGRLDDDPDYEMAWIDRWTELRRGPLSNERLLSDLDRTAVFLQGSQVRNFERWAILDKDPWPGRAAPRWGNRATFDKEVAWMRNWLAQRLAWIDSQTPAPPTFSPPSGAVVSNALVELSEDRQFKSTGGMLYVTFDGSDPRLPAGDLNPVARVYEGPLSVSESATLRARYLSDSGNWGALGEGVYHVDVVPADASSLVISEIHYNPSGSDAFEFIELANRGASPIELRGVRLEGAVDYEFVEQVLSPSEMLVVVEDGEAFASRYQSTGSRSYSPGIRVAGQWRGGLSNAGETVILKRGATTLVSFEYGDAAGWPVQADGGGPSLELTDLASDPGKASNWQASLARDGSPGRQGGLAFTGWSALHFSELELRDDAISGKAADGDGDGLTNIQEYLFGTHPRVTDETPPLRVAIQPLDIDGTLASYITMSYSRVKDPSLVYGVEVSNDLINWVQAEALTLIEPIENEDGRTRSIILRAEEPLDARSPDVMFYRVFALLP